MSKGKNFQHFIGVDVSKNTLDFCLLEHQKEHFFHIKNNKKALSSLLSKLKRSFSLELHSTLFCVENTGDYTNHLLYFLGDLKANIWLEMPMKIKKSSGLNRLKTDKTDALIIAQYARRFEDRFKPWTKPRKEIARLKKLFALREKLTRNINQYLAPAKGLSFNQDAQMMTLQKDSFNRVVKVLKQEREMVEEQIKNIIGIDKKLSRIYKIITSVPGIGFVAAVDLIINTNEFETITDAKKYACYAGIAPFEQSSGTALFKTRVSHLANKNAKKAIHMGAMSAVNKTGELKDYYYRKIAEGKPKMSALNAVRNKIIHRVFACIKRKEEYQVDYKKMG